MMKFITCNQINGHVETKNSSYFIKLTFFQSLSKLENDIKYKHYSVDSHNMHESIKNSEKSYSKNKSKTHFLSIFGIIITK